MIKLITLFTTSLILFTACHNKQPASLHQKAFEESHPNFSNQFESELRQLFQEKALYGDFLFAVVDENGLVYSYALNRDLLEGKPSSLDNTSPIYIASHTKSFTATLLKILEQQGKLDLNSSLAQYLPALHFNDSIDTNTISIKSLLNHTHGTFSPTLTWKTAFLGYGGTNAELINDFNNDFLFDASRKFRYSNIGPIIAGMVVDKTTNRSWKDQMRTQIFEPLKMAHTSAYVSDFDLHSIRPSVTANAETGIYATGFYKKDITMHAAGGIISTIDDLSKWLKANINQEETLLTKADWKDLHQATTEQDKQYFTYNRTAYSLGWDIAEYQGDTILTRFGGLAGISFHISFMPTRKLGIIAFSTDSRAYALPHLMANHAYNQLNLLDADSLFKVEKERFSESYDRENKASYPLAADILQNSAINNYLIGDYTSESGWPAIAIVSKENSYELKWGILSGKVYKGQDNNFLATLGVLERNFELRNDTLFTGSLIYTKTKK